MKLCKKCNTFKDLNKFYYQKTGKFNRRSMCKSCHNKYSRKYKSKFRKVHKEKIKIYSSKYCEQYYIINKEQIKEKVRIYNKNNKGKTNSLKSKRRASKLKRTPKWINYDDIKEIYNNCPIGYNVDHIIPLQGKIVSGLHVPWNLQYLTKRNNSIKKNKFDGTYNNSSWKIST